MGGRDHSETCPTCGFQRGGMNDATCCCDVAAAPKHYAKKREAVRAVQWTGDRVGTAAVRALLAPRAVHHNTETGQLLLGNGWCASPSNWVLSVTGEDIAVLSDDVFRHAFEAVDARQRSCPDDAEHEAAGKAFTAQLDKLLGSALRLAPDQHPDIFIERNALVYELRRLLEDHAWVTARRERQRLLDRFTKELSP